MPTDLIAARKVYTQYLQGKEAHAGALNGAFMAAIEFVYQKAFEEGLEVAYSRPPLGWTLVPILPTEEMRINWKEKPELFELYSFLIREAPLYVPVD